MKVPTLLKQSTLSFFRKLFRPQRVKYASAILLVLLAVAVSFFFSPARSQTRQRTVANNGAPADATTPARPEVVKVDVDLVTVDALVLQKNTARIVGDLKRDDFILSEDGVKQDITHFGQDTLPLSVLLLIDRSGCLDPFGEQTRWQLAQTED